MRHRKKRRASAAQLRALARGRATLAARRSRKAAPSRPKRPTRRRRRAPKAVRVRPAVRRKSHRRKRQGLPALNPFLGGLAMIGNPRRRKRRSHRKSHRRSLVRRNPMGAVLAAPRQMVSKDFLTEAASVAAGFVLPNLILPQLPLAVRDATWKAYASKVAVIAALSGAASMVNKRVSRAILLGGGVSVLLDAWTDFVAPALMGGGTPRPSGGTSAYWGDPGDPGAGVSAYWGNPGEPGVGASIADAFGGESEGAAWG